MILTKMVLKAALIFMLFLGASGCTKSAEPAEMMSVDNVALDGYDPVSYFTSAKAAKGDPGHAHAYKGLQWHFESDENLEMFRDDPELYTPAFGGFCADALADGELVLSTPEYWYIHNGKLYLFEDEDAKQEWFREISSVLPAGLAQWERLLEPAADEE